MGLLQDKNIVITGGSRGFGLVTAQACIEAGAKVAIASRSTKTVANAVDKLQMVGDVMGMTCDIANTPASVLKRVWFRIIDGHPHSQRAAATLCSSSPLS